MLERRAGVGESLSFIGLISIRLSFVVAVAVVLSVAGNCLDKEEFMASRRHALVDAVLCG